MRRTFVNPRSLVTEAMYTGKAFSFKRTFLAVGTIVVTLLISLCALTACASPSSEAGSGTISVVSREDGSGTRGAFVELMGIEQDDGSGEKVDMTTPSAVVTNSTSVMMTTVAGDPNAIGYISLGSLNDSVKALKVDDVEATTDNVKNGTYAVSRPFNIVVTGDLDGAPKDFVDFIMSADGQAIVEKEGYIAVDENAPSYKASGATGNVVVAGSSSVTPVMEKLAEAYETLNDGASVEVNQSDSTTGVTSAIEGTCDIGMASRALKDSETSQGAQATPIAQDGIAVIVNPASSIDGLSSDQITRIYTGEVTNWVEV